MHRFCLTALLIFSVLLVGCAKKYPDPVMEPTELSFDGIRTAINNSPQKTVSVVAIHGMCNHNEIWAKNILLKFASGMQMKASELTPVPGNGWVMAHKATLTDTANTVNFYFIIYSRATLAVKQKDLCSDVSNVKKSNEDKSKIWSTEDVCLDPGYQYSRAKLNAKVKNGFMNDCLADAIIYLGKTGEIIRSGVRDALKRIGKDRQGKNIAGTPVFLISESLGSKVLRDALVCGEAPKDLNFSGLLKETEQIFLIADQIALLNQGNNIGPCADGIFSSGLSGLLEAIDVSRESEDVDINSRGQLIKLLEGAKLTRNERVGVVAFNDPNDLLNYLIKPEHYKERNVGNIIISNDYTIAGQIENPITAHKGYLDNKKIMNLILNGHGQAVVKKTDKAAEN